MEKPSPDMTPEGWHAVAAAYDETITPFTRIYAEAAMDAGAVNRGDRVLDVATGGGALALLAAERGAQVTATDFARGMVDRVRRRAKEEGLEDQVEARVMDAQELTLADGTFDAAFCVFGIMFVPDRVKAYREMRRVLRPDGRAIVTTWTAPDRQEVFRVFARAIQAVAPDLPPPPRPPTPYSVSEASQLEREMSGAGFRDVTVRTVSRDWAAPSAQALWDSIQQANPIFPTLIDRVGEAKAPALRDAFVGALTARFGGGPVSLESEALVAVGQR